jgi:hypothetical protein
LRWGGLVLIFLGIRLNEEAKFALLDVLLGFKESSHVGDVLEEGGTHEGLLAVQARNLGDLVDEVQKAGRDVDDLAAHNLEELAQKLAGLGDEINGGNLFRPSGIALGHKKLLHLNVVVLAEELQEAEDAAKG